MLNGIKPRFDFSVAQLAGRQLNSSSIVDTSGMLGPWAVPEGTNANGDQSEIHLRPVSIEANMVATSSAQVGSLQVGPVSDRAGDVGTPPL